MTTNTRKKLGETLIEMGIINQTTLNRALDRQQGTDKRLGQILEEMDVLLEEDIAQALAKQFGFRYAKGLSRFQFPPEVLELCDAETAIRNLVFPLKIEGKTLHLAMTDPLDIRVQDDLSFKIGLNISPCVTSPSEIKRAIKKNYSIEMDQSDEDTLGTILIVDGQEQDRSNCKDILNKQGYKIHLANTGVDGLQRAVQIRPQLILAAIVLPELDGESMLSSLRTNQKTAEIPVIALTESPTAEEEYRLLEMGFFDLLVKPLEEQRLVARVRRAFRINAVNN